MSEFQTQARAIISAYRDSSDEGFDSTLFRLSELISRYDAPSEDEQSEDFCREIIQAHIALYQVGLRKGDVIDIPQGEVYDLLMVKAKGYIRDEGLAVKLVEDLYHGPRPAEEWKPSQAKLPPWWRPEWGDPPPGLDL